MDYFSTTYCELGCRPNDFDRLGHINNAVVLELFEAARWNWLQQHEIDERSEIVPVVARVEVDYLAQLVSDRVFVSTQLIRPAEDWRDELTYKAVLKQVIKQTRDGREAVSGRITIAFIDKDNQNLASLQDCLLGAAAKAAPHTV